MAEVDFHNIKSDGATFVCKVHYFFVSKWFGCPESRPEENMITPTWFWSDHMPYNQMMPADQDFMEPFFNGSKIKAKAFLGPFQKEKLKLTRLEFVDGFD